MAKMTTQRAPKGSPTLITIRVHNVRVTLVKENDMVKNTLTSDGPHLQAIGYMPGGQVLIQSAIRAGHSPSVQADAVREIASWLHTHRKGWDIETLPGEGVVGCPGGDGCPQTGR
jgi:hypothetical protein